MLTGLVVENNLKNTRMNEIKQTGNQNGIKSRKNLEEKRISIQQKKSQKIQTPKKKKDRKKKKKSGSKYSYLKKHFDMQQSKPQQTKKSSLCQTQEMNHPS